MPPINVLVMIHGMSPEPEPRSPFDSQGKFWGYNEFWRNVCEEQPALLNLFPEGFIGVEWGHELPQRSLPSVEQLREDQRLTRAQNFVNKKIAYDNLAKDPHSNNVTLSLFSERGADIPLLTPMVRSLVVGLRQSIVTCGLGDVIYYTSEQGECFVRQTVYHQVLEKLAQYEQEQDVRIHLIGQSLGVTLTHDFLYGLFALDHEPGFYKQASEEDKQRFKTWRQKRQNGQLKLGSLTSTASQLPLFMMRKQELVDRLAKGEPIEAKDIGIEDSNQVQWQIFYDIDDLLGFGTRRLYNSANAIKEYQVDTGDNPGDAHTGYWQNRTVIKRTAQLLYDNASKP